MSRQLTLPCCDPSTSFAEGSRARTYPQQDEEQGSRASAVGSGASTRGSSRKSSRGSSSSRTSQCFDGEVLALSSLTFPRAGMMRRGIAYPLPPSAPLTDVTGSSWSRGEYTSLDTWAKRATQWPTPTARDWKSGASNQHGKNARPLNEVAALWPTPTAMDAANSRRHGYTLSGHGGTTLSDAMDFHHHQTPRTPGRRGQAQVDLNPEFVEVLMGFPVGWTEIPDSELSEMRSSRKSRKPSGGSSSK